MPFLFLLLLPLNPLAQHRLTVTQPAMGTQFRITLYARDTLAGHRAIQQSFRLIEHLEASMSDYRPASEINRLVQLPTHKNHAVSTQLWEVLRASQVLARRSHGAFDPTVGPLSKLWRRAFRQQVFPPPERISRAGSRVHWKWLRAKRDTTVVIKRNDLQIDLGGIAKGYALDAVGALLSQAGFPAFLLDGGGDLLLGAPPPGEDGWKINNFPSQNCYVAITTSGSTYRYLAWEGKRYSHLIDPRTGLGVTSPRLVTVTGPRGMIADGLASACSVLNERDARRLMRKYPGYCLTMRVVTGPSSSSTVN